MSRCLSTRRDFLKGSLAGVLAGGTLPLSRVQGAAISPVPEALDPTLTRISGGPKERGSEYGTMFGESIRDFLSREIWKKFITERNTKKDLLKYAERCHREILSFSPSIGEELEGIAEGAGLDLEEAVLLTLHEELYHRGPLPAVSHCTAAAAGPPSTSDGSTYAAQSWDWMKSVYGLSSVLLWSRLEGPSVLAYSYPGLWISAGVNSSGLALVWTSAALDVRGPGIGIPTYALIAHLLYQETLDDALEEARRANQAGWFAFVLADGKGNLARVDGSPTELAIERTRGHLSGVYYGTHQMTRTPPGERVPRHPQCQGMYDLLDAGEGKIDLDYLKRCFADHETPICKHLTPERGGGTLDVMVFNPTRREAHLTRGPACQRTWKTFRFDTETGNRPR